MTKLEELSELLVSEIEQFEKTVEKLQKIQEQKITINSSKLESIIREHHENYKIEFASHKRIMETFGRKLERSKAYPLWALITFMISLLINGILIYSVILNF